MPQSPSRPSLAYQLSGPAEGPGLVFVNGLGGLKEGWFYQVRHFSGRWRVLTFDNRGAGASEAAHEPASMATFAQDLVGLLDHLGLRRVSVVGISFGGRVAQELALGWPERVERLVLVATSCGASRPEPGVASLDALREAQLTEADWLERVIPVLFGPRYRAAHERRLRTFAAGRARLPVNAVGLQRQWEAHGGFNACDRLHLIGVPTLVVHGADDALSPLAHAHALADGIPDARLVVLPDVGHSPNVEAPPAFNAALQAFLEA